MKLKKQFLAIMIIAIALILQTGCQEETTTAPEKVEIEAKPTQKVAPKVAPVKEPKLQVGEPTLDFGVMGPNKKNAGKYDFKNVGNGTLKITKIRSTCGCTVPELDKKQYAPGESGTINVTFRSSTRQGHVAKHLYIESNDPDNPKFELTIKAEIKLSVEVIPIKIELTLNEGDAAPTITLKSKDGKPFAIKSFTCTKNVMTATFDPTVKATEFVVQPLVNSELLAKNLRGVIKIGITHPLTAEATITYAAKAEFEVTRPRIIIQNAEPGKVVTKDIWITSSYERKAEVESITIDKGHIKVLDQKNNGNDLKISIEVTVPPKAGKSRYFSDTVKIKLKTGQTFEVRCNGFYKRDMKL